MKVLPFAMNLRQMSAQALKLARRQSLVHGFGGVDLEKSYSQ
jgi:hypothetical protein